MRTSCSVIDLRPYQVFDETSDLWTDGTSAPSHSLDIRSRISQSSFTDVLKDFSPRAKLCQLTNRVFQSGHSQIPITRQPVYSHPRRPHPGILAFEGQEFKHLMILLQPLDHTSAYGHRVIWYPVKTIMFLTRQPSPIMTLPTNSPARQPSQKTNREEVLSNLEGWSGYSQNGCQSIILCLNLIGCYSVAKCGSDFPAFYRPSSVRFTISIRLNRRNVYFPQLTIWTGHIPTALVSACPFFGIQLCPNRCVFGMPPLTFSSTLLASMASRHSQSKFNSDFFCAANQHTTTVFPWQS